MCVNLIFINIVLGFNYCSWFLQSSDGKGLTTYYLGYVCAMVSLLIVLASKYILPKDDSFR